jgi:hypothetical protein
LARGRWPPGPPNALPPSGRRAAPG